MEWLTDPQSWIALATLTVLEVVLGIDNIIFISILAGKLPLDQQPKARTAGRTKDFFSGRLLDDFNGISAMWANDVHRQGLGRSDPGRVCFLRALSLVGSQPSMETPHGSAYSRHITWLSRQSRWPIMTNRSSGSSCKRCIPTFFGPRAVWRW